MKYNTTPEIRQQLLAVVQSVCVDKIIAQLKPCPFCEGELDYTEHTECYPAEVWCASCFATTGNVPCIEEAILAWNSEDFKSLGDSAEFYNKETS